MAQVSGFVRSPEATMPRAGSARAGTDPWLIDASSRAARAYRVGGRAYRAGARALARAWRAAAVAAQHLARSALAAGGWLVAQLHGSLGTARPMVAPLAASAIAAGLALAIAPSSARALDAGAWVFLVAMLLSLHASQRRQAALMQRELNELKQLLHVTRAVLQVEEVEGAEEIVESDEREPERRGRRKAVRSGTWRRRLGLPWRA